MDYIILDMEWNDTTPKISNKDGCTLVHEIIQVGAVKLDKHRKIVDTFRADIRPKIYKHMRGAVLELTGITEAELEEGSDIGSVVSRLRQWCGEDYIFLTWGAEDIPVLFNNLDFFELDSGWIPFYFNAQALFNMQTNNSGRAYSLEYAMEYYGINCGSRLHNALNDAICAAEICSKLDIESGIAKSGEYEGTEFGKFDIPGSCGREIKFEYKDITDAAENGFCIPCCPVCGRKLKNVSWYRVSGDKFIADGRCGLHRGYAVIIEQKRISQNTVEVIKSTYAVGRINKAYFNFVERRVPEVEKWQ